MSHASISVSAFMVRRADLSRYFAARIGDADAEDLLQEIYLRVASLPADMDVQNAGGYLYRLGNNIMLDRLSVALTELPHAVQQSFRLHKLEGLTHAQVAERMGVSRSLIEKHMMRALGHLSARLGC